MKADQEDRVAPFVQICRCILRGRTAARRVRHLRAAPLAPPLSETPKVEAYSDARTAAVVQGELVRLPCPGKPGHHAPQRARANAPPSPSVGTVHRLQRRLWEWPWDSPPAARATAEPLVSVPVGAPFLGYAAASAPSRTRTRFIVRSCCADRRDPQPIPPPIPALPPTECTGLSPPLRIVPLPGGTRTSPFPVRYNRGGWSSSDPWTRCCRRTLFGSALERR